MVRRTMGERTDRHEALELLASSVRRLVAASVRTGLGADDLRALAAEVDAIADRAAAVADDDPWYARATSTDVLADPVGVLGITPVVGRANPLRPDMEVELHEGGIEGTLRFGLQHVGPPGRAHGGMVAAALDQALGIAAMAGGRPGFTAEMTVRYLAATPVEEDLRFEAHITEGDERTSTITAAITDSEGRVTADAHATFVRNRGIHR